MALNGRLGSGELVELIIRIQETGNSIYSNVVTCMTVSFLTHRNVRRVKTGWLLCIFISLPPSDVSPSDTISTSHRTAVLAMMFSLLMCAWCRSCRRWNITSQPAISSPFNRGENKVFQTFNQWTNQPASYEWYPNTTSQNWQLLASRKNKTSFRYIDKTR